MLIEKVTKEYLQYLKSVKRYSDNTVKSYQADLDGFRFYCIEYSKKEISEITEKFIKSYLMILSESGIGRKSISRKISSIKGLFKFAYLNEYIKINSASAISGPKVKRNLPEIASASSILDAYKEIDKEESKQYNESDLEESINDLQVSD